MDPDLQEQQRREALIADIGAVVQSTKDRLDKPQLVQPLLRRRTFPGGERIHCDIHDSGKPSASDAAAISATL